MTWNTFSITVSDKIAELKLNRPEALNSMVPAFWRELPEAVEELDARGDVRVLIISSTGKHFTAGMDFAAFASLAPDAALGEGRARASVMQMVERLQHSFTCLEAARFPVIAAIQGGCIGGGVDLVSACDMRFCTSDAFFSIHEINLAMTADVGTFPRLQRLIPEGIARELAFTGERLAAERAYGIGLVNHVLDDHPAMLRHARQVAGKIAAKSPLAVWGSKQMLNYGRDHGTADTLKHVATWQSGMLDFKDIHRAVAAQQEGSEVEHADLAPNTPLEE